LNLARCGEDSPFRLPSLNGEHEAWNELSC
jgi:hypothetical protein